MNSLLRKTSKIVHLRIVCIFVILLVGCWLSVYANNVNLDDIAIRTAPLTVTVGESEIINTQLPTIRVSVTNPKIAEVQVLTSYQVMLQGIQVGTTDLIIWGEGENNVQRWKVNIVLDTDNYQKKLGELFPNSALEVSLSGETLIVKGWLRKANQVEQLHSYLDKTGIEYVDMTSVAGVQQVQLQVRVAEVSHTALRTLRVETIYSGKDFFGILRPTPFSGTPLTSDVTIGPGSASADFSSAVTVLAGVPKADLDLFIRALAENQYLKLLANPTLVALSGEKASFLAGGEFPIPVSQDSGSGGGNSITISYREYGVRLTFQPFVLGDGSIRLHVMPEVSELTETGGVSLSGFNVKALLTRKAETTLELKSGQTFAMAGLIKQKTEAVSSRLPGLGDLPLIGTLFRTTNYIQEDVELVVLVTASLVEPMSLAQTPPLPGFLHSEPNDWELYIDGRFEGEAPATIHQSDADRLRQLGLDRLVGPGAWEVQD